MFFFKLEFKVSAYGFPLTLIISSRDRQWCTGSLLAVTRLHFPPVLEPIDWVCLLLPTTLMSSLIVLLCPRTQRLEKLCCTSGLFWPSLCTCSVGSQSPEPSRHGVARPMDSWQPDNGVMSFWGFFFLNHPLRVMYMWLIFPLPIFPTHLRCSALSRTESRLDQCIVFLFQSHLSELKTRKVTQVRFGRDRRRAVLVEALARPI